MKGETETARVCVCLCAFMRARERERERENELERESERAREKVSARARAVADVRERVQTKCISSRTKGAFSPSDRQKKNSKKIRKNAYQVGTEGRVVQTRTKNSTHTLTHSHTHTKSSRTRGAFSPATDTKKNTPKV
jgi:hypothetical protein